MKRYINSNLVEPFRSLSVNSQINNPLNAIESIDLTVISKTKTDNYFEFIFHLNPEFAVNLSAQNSNLASIEYNDSNKTLTISNIKLDESNKILQPIKPNVFGQLVGWNITKTSLDNVVSELLELSNGEIFPGTISNSFIALTRNENYEYLKRFIDLMKVNGLENADQPVDDDPNSGTLLNSVYIYDYKDENNRKTIDISLNLGDSKISQANSYYFAKNNFEEQQNTREVWYEYDNLQSLIIHNFPIDSFTVSNYWNGSTEFASWINEYINFNTTYKGLDLTNSLDENFYKLLNIPKEYVQKVEIKKAEDRIGEFNSLSIVVDKDLYYLEDVSNNYFGDEYYGKNGSNIYDYRVINNNEIQIYLNSNQTNIFDKDQKVINVDMEKFVDFIQSKTSDKNIETKLPENYTTLGIDKNSQYFNDLCESANINSSDVDNFSFEFELDDNNKLSIPSISVNLVENVHNFWNTNPFYSQNKIKVENNASRIYWSANLSTNWQNSSPIVDIEINKQTYDKFIGLINSINETISVDANNVYDIVGKLNENDIATRFLKQYFDIDSVYAEIYNVTLSNSENPSQGLDIELSLRDDMDKFKFISNESIDNIEIVDDGGTIIFKNVKSDKIQIIQEIKFTVGKASPSGTESDIEKLITNLETLDFNDKIVNKDNQGEYKLNESQTNQVYECISNTLTNLNILGNKKFDLEVKIFDNGDVEVAIQLPEGFEFKEDKKAFIDDVTKQRYSFDKSEPRILKIKNFNFLDLTLEK